jgi:SAM-dependent methyltransferase
VLELAAGTGALTRELLPRLSSDATLVVTDLQEAMLDVARRIVPHEGCAKCLVADALDLPFDDASFDLVLCQFGWMFFPDKPVAGAEAARVLRDGGTFGFLVWHSVEENEIAAIAKKVVGSFLPDGPPRGFDIPFGFADHTTLLADLGHNFEAVSFEDVSLVGHSTPADAARGFCRGTPMALELAERIPDKHAEVQTALAAAYAARYGDGPFEAKLNALYVEART